MTANKKQLLLQGVAAAPGIIIGRAVVLKREKLQIKPVPINSSRVDKEISDFKRAISRVKKDLEKLAIAVGKRLGPEHARIFEAQAMIADDRVIVSRVIDLIKEKKLSAAYLYHQQVGEVLEQLASSEDIYLKERSMDINTVCTRLIGVLQGVKKSVVRDVEGPTVVIAGIISPADLLGFSVRKKVGVAMEIGGITSHTSLLAKSLNLPAVVGLGSDIDKINTDDRIILDGYTGKLYVNPEKEIIRTYRGRRKNLVDLNIELLTIKEKPAKTRDGYRVRLFNNIELPSETTRVIKSGAEGIGLYRTEYMLLTDNSFPGFDRQLRIYRSILEKMGDRPVIIRTYDLGGDKFKGSSTKTVDPNPFLGWRAIRFCLDNPDVFKVQLKALLKASTYGNLEIMLPMISNLEELLETKKLIRQCKEELTTDNIRFKDNIPLGIMVEVPSAVLLAEHLAAEVDFFSLGTNDLIQYTLAVDRTNELLAHLYQSFNPAVLKMIDQTIKAGHKHGIRVGICGELAADPYGVVLLVGLGADELSTSYLSTGLVKRIVRAIARDKAEEIAARACRQKTASQVEDYLKRKVKDYFPDLATVIDSIKGGNHA